MTFSVEKVKQTYFDVIKAYPEYVTQQQAAQICGREVQVISRLEKAGVIPYTKAIDGRLHYHKIKTIDVLMYLYNRDYQQANDSAYMHCLKSFYIEKYKNYADCLYSCDVSEMTGYSMTSVQKWVNNGYLKARKGSVFLISKT